MKASSLGTALLVASAIAYSSAGFYTRLVTVDSWTMLFWRGLFAGLFLAGMVAWRERGRTVEAIRGIGRDGLLIALGSAVATICFLSAMRITSVADVMVIDATIPFWTAGLAWLALGERESRTTLLATLAALAGVAVMMGFTGEKSHLLGVALTFVMAILMAGVLVMIRRKRNISMLPAVGLSAFLCALLVLPFSRPLDVGGHELFLLGLFGASQFGLGLLLLALGTPLISATRGALIGVLQTPLAILWVWLAFGEMPAVATLIGGSVVLAAVLADMLFGQQQEPVREQRAARLPAGSPARQADER